LKKKKVLDFIFILLSISICLVLYGFAVFSKGDLGSLGVSFAMFNVTFSVGLAGILIATITLVQKSQSKDLKPQIVTFLNEFVVFVLLNLLLLLASHSNISWLIHIFIGLTVISTLVIIFGSRSFIHVYLEKIKPLGE
jgi:uncharacterized membrane protein YczE